MKIGKNKNIPELTDEEVEFAHYFVDKLETFDTLSEECKKFANLLAKKLFKVSKKPESVFELSIEDKRFVLEIAEMFEIPPETMALYLKNLMLEIWNTTNKIDQNALRLDNKPFIMKFYNRKVLLIIYLDWEIKKYKKYIIAGLVLIHLKLDKYHHILTRKEFYSAKKHEVQIYNRYLYDIMKSRFKFVEKPSGSVLHEIKDRKTNSF